MINRKRFEELKASRQLPSPPGVVMNVLRLAEDEESNAADIAKALQTDPALAGRILKYANSAYIGAARPVISLLDAVSRLGSRCVYRLALGFSLVSQYGRGTCQRFNHQQYWSRSLATAIAAQLLSRTTRQGNSDELFMCGLLCDVGSLALATMHPETYDELLGRKESISYSDLLRMEKQAFAMDQVDLTTAMLEDWGLPEEYILAIRCLGHPESVEISPGKMIVLLSLLDMSRRIGRFCTTTDEERPRLAQVLMAQASRIELTTANLSQLCEQVVREWQEWGRNMDVPTAEVPALTDFAQPGKTPVRQTQSNQTPTQQPETDRLRILLASGDEACLTRLVEEVTAAGFETVTATDSQQALRMALETWPQLIITDWQLPGGSGLELCRILRKSQSGQQFHIIQLLPSDADEFLVAALDAGSDDFCVKPWRSKILTTRLRAGSRSIQLQRALEREREEVRQVAARLAVANRQLEQSAFTDSLTGLPNRAFARDTLIAVWASSGRDNRPLTCMMIDIDHFKRINDNHGHDVGDLVLQRTAAALKASVRPSDVVCRLGGEEFLVLCKNTTTADGLALAERIRRNVAINRIKAPAFTGAITISIGLASRTPEMLHPEEMLKEADRAVYAAKHAGRNCVRSATGAPPVVEQPSVAAPTQTARRSALGIGLRPVSSSGARSDDRP
jgi:two-component system cell cycle response regulator